MVFDEHSRSKLTLLHHSDYSTDAPELIFRLEELTESDRRVVSADLSDTEDCQVKEF